MYTKSLNIKVFCFVSGFGIVREARHKVDGQLYAVKEIPFKYLSQHVSNQVMREVTLSAPLESHPNLVAYKTAWVQNHRVRTRRRETLVDCHDLLNASITTGTTVTFREESTISSNEVNVVSSSFRSSSSESYVTFEKDDSFGSSQVTSTNQNLIVDHCNRSSSQALLVHPQRKVSSAINIDLRHFEIQATLFIQMELCGQNLRTYLDSRNQTIFEQIKAKPDGCQCPLEYIDVSKTMDYFVQLLKGVDYIHTNHLIHRDLKPMNILFSLDMTRIKIADFGLATRHKKDEPGGHLHQPSSPFHTTGLGTCVYAAPEQKSSQDYDRRVDMYSLGIILFELFFPCETAMERSKMIVGIKKQPKPQFPDNFIQKWPVLVNVVTRLTQTDQSRRPDRIGDLLKLLTPMMLGPKKKQQHFRKRSATVVRASPVTADANNNNPSTRTLNNDSLEVTKLKALLDVEKRRNDQLTKQVTKQEKEIISLKKQLENLQKHNPSMPNH